MEEKIVITITVEQGHMQVDYNIKEEEMVLQIIEGAKNYLYKQQLFNEFITRLKQDASKIVKPKGLVLPPEMINK